MELTCIADREERLSSFLRGEMKLSSSLMNKLKWGDAIRVNGKPEHTNYPCVPGDRITVNLEEPKPLYEPEEGPLSILYEDEWLLAADKPAGMLIHPSRARNSGTLANYVMGYYERTGQNSLFHPLTRLDRDTFGVVLLAKNAYTHTLLQQIPVEKTYHALTLGAPAEDKGTIDLPIARKPLPSLLREVSPEGKPSLTEYQVLERRGNLSKLALRPVTGRTHQLRVHCAACGFPILGDPQYGSPACGELSGKLGLSSQLLCARQLKLQHPVTGLALNIVSQMDVDLQNLKLP